MLAKLITKRNLYAVIFVIALASMLGSLYFSEIIGLEPCLLCWYQRILMYPLVPLSLVGLLSRDIAFPRYVLPLSIIGIGIAGYHYIIQQLSTHQVSVIAPCTADGASCTAIYISYFGFITIPLLSFVSFVAITIFSLLSLRAHKWK